MTKAKCLTLPLLCCFLYEKKHRNKNKYPYLFMFFKNKHLECKQEIHINGYLWGTGWME